jgi:hypothetical protein
MNIPQFASGEFSFHGAGGDDAMNLPANSDLLGRRVNFYGDDGTGNRINQVSNSKTAASTLHVDENTIGAAPGDDFFAPGGSVYFQSVQILQLRMGSGEDTAYVQPNTIASMNINGGDPTTAPGDTLNLAFAGAENPVFTPGAPGNGGYTFDNRAPLNYSNFETGPNIDDVGPTADVIDVDPDPRTTSVESIDIVFSEAVTGLDLADLSLTRDGGPNLLSGAESLSTLDNITWTLGGLTTLTAITGSYTLALTALGSGVIDVGGNSIAGDANDTWDVTLPAWLAPGSLATWDPLTMTLTVTGAATIIADPGLDLPTINAADVEAVLTIDPAVDLQVHAAALNLSNGAAATIASLGGARTAENHRVLVLNSISIDAGSKLDITDNDVIIDYTGASIAVDVEADVAGGYNVVGDWLGNGITSSIAALDGNFAVGVADNAMLAAPFGTVQGGPLFAGVDVDLDAVLIKFTHRVDIDLDGLITPNDASVFGTSYSENDPANWALGDLDYDGLFTPNDASIFGTFYDESLPAV